MERRLCHRRLDVPQGLSNPDQQQSAANLTLPEAHDKVHQQKIEEYRTLGGVVAGSQLDSALQKAYADPAKLDEMIRMQKTKFPERAKETALMFRSELAASQEVLNAALKGDVRNRVSDIIRNLQKPISAKNPTTHPYGHGDGGVNFKQIETDRAFIQSIIPAFPQVADHLQRVDSALDRLRMQDSRYGIRDFQNLRKENKFDKMAGGILKITGVFALGIAALATGLPAVVQGIKTGKLEFMAVAPPLLFMGTAGLIASPQLRSQIFASADQKMLADINMTVNNPAFRQLTDEYTLRGDGWARIVETIMKKPADAQTFTATLRKNGGSITGIEKEVDAYIRKTARTEEDRAALRTMIEDGRFPDLVRILGGTSTKEGRGIIGDYIRMGAQPFMANMRAEARAINQATSANPSS